MKIQPSYPELPYYPAVGGEGHGHGRHSVADLLVLPLLPGLGFILFPRAASYSSRRALGTTIECGKILDKAAGCQGRFTRE